MSSSDERRHRIYKELLARRFQGFTIPEELSDCHGFEYIDDSSEQSCFFPFGDCLLTFDDAAMHAWFGDAGARTSADLLVFLQGADGFLVGFWHRGKRNLNEVPIVYLDDENIGNAVVACNLRDYLSLAARLDTERPSPDNVRYLNEVESIPQPVVVRDFYTRRGIEPAADPIAILDRATPLQAEFEKWLSSMLA